MKRYVIELYLPGIGGMNRAQLDAPPRRPTVRSQSSPARPEWQHSYIADNKTFCIYVAEDEAAVRTREIQLFSGDQGDRSVRHHRSDDRECLIM